jgi:DNA-binding response OmpR family regulator
MAHILLIDDDKSIGEVTSIVLEDLGHSVTVVSSLKTLTTLKNIKADLILLDINIGALSGKETIYSIKNIPTVKNLPIILFSADDRIEILAKEFGARGILKKPFEISELSKVIETHISI